MIKMKRSKPRTKKQDKSPRTHFQANGDASKALCGKGTFNDKTVFIQTTTQIQNVTCAFCNRIIQEFKMNENKTAYERALECKKQWRSHKTHYTIKTYPIHTICGVEKRQKELKIKLSASRNIEQVTCKNCLKNYSKPEFKKLFFFGVWKNVTFHEPEIRIDDDGNEIKTVAEVYPMPLQIGYVIATPFEFTDFLEEKTTTKKQGNKIIEHEYGRIADWFLDTIIQGDPKLYALFEEAQKKYGEFLSEIDYDARRRANKYLQMIFSDQ